MRDALLMTIIVLLAIGGFFYLATRSNDCDEKGGVLMKNAWGTYQCVKPVQ